VIVVNDFRSETSACASDACATALYFSNASSPGAFTRGSQNLPHAHVAALADIDGDADLDVMLCGSYHDGTSGANVLSSPRAPMFYLNQGDGSFVQATASQIGDPLDTSQLDSCDHIAFGDYNNDVRCCHATRLYAVGRC
jgi:hypothetical protein